MPFNKRSGSSVKLLFWSHLEKQETKKQCETVHCTHSQRPDWYICSKGIHVQNTGHEYAWHLQACLQPSDAIFGSPYAIGPLMFKTTHLTEHPWPWHGAFTIWVNTPTPP